MTDECKLPKDSHDANQTNKDLNNNFKDQRYFELWKFHTETIEKLKDKLWTQSTWLFGILTGIASYAFTQKFSVNESDQMISGQLIGGLVFVGALLCMFTLFLSYSIGKHIQRNWKRQEKCLAFVEELKIVFPQRPQKQKKQSFPEEPFWIAILTIVYFSVFIFIALYQ